MILNRTNFVLFILLLIVAGLAAAIEVDYEQPNFEFLPEMKRSAASDSYEANPNFPNRRTLQAPVAGTIARGEMPLHYAATKEDAVRAGEELQNPITSAMARAVTTAPPNEPAEDSVTEAAPDNEPGSATLGEKQEVDPAQILRESVDRGGEVYRVFCISCHGPTGAGDGPVAKRGFPPPPPLTTGKSVQMKDGQLFHILTYGQGSMAPMDAQLSRDRRWDVVNYVRDMQQSAAEKLSSIDPTAGETNSRTSNGSADTGGTEQ